MNTILPLLINEPLLYEPGTAQEYSNYGYIILGAILEKDTGEQYEGLIPTRILQLLGMKDNTLILLKISPEKPKNIALEWMAQRPIIPPCWNTARPMEELIQRQQICFEILQKALAIGPEMPSAKRMVAVLEKGD